MKNDLIMGSWGIITALWVVVNTSVKDLGAFFSCLGILLAVVTFSLGISHIKSYFKDE